MIEQIRPDAFHTWLSSVNQKVIVLDVREAWEVQTASVEAKDFELVCIPLHLLAIRYNELPKEQPIACLCHHGARSYQAAIFLKAQGFENVVNISGGIDAWSTLLDPHVPRY
jgi:rhodanese-related sulfurtransferase